MQYIVEYKSHNPGSIFGWEGRNFDTLLEATNFYSQFDEADLLIYEIFQGMYFIYRKWA